MRHQYYIIGRETAPNHYELQRFTVPVHQVDGQWVPAGEPSDETHLWHRFDLLLDINDFQVYTDNTAGKLDDLPCPEGWKVLARDWLPDGYVPPTAAELEQRSKDAETKLREMGVWRDPS